MEDNSTEPTSKSPDQSNRDEKTLKWKLLGLFAPPIGLALYFQMKKERPQAAEAVLFGTIISFTVVFLGLFILGIVLGANAS